MAAVKIRKQKFFRKIVVHEHRENNEGERGRSSRAMAIKKSSSHVCASQWVCEVCESSPATVTCKADAVALCAACDVDVHSANPLAHRHIRIPIYRFFGDAMSHGHHRLSEKFTTEGGMEEDDDSGDDEQEANSWLLSQPTGKNSNKADESFLLGVGGGNGGNGGAVDEYLDLIDYGDPCSRGQSHVSNQYSHLQGRQEVADGADRIVPAQDMKKSQHQRSNQQQYLEFEFENKKGE